MKKVLCGVDIGGTKLAVALVNNKGKIIDKVIVFDHIHQNEGQMLVYIKTLITKLCQNNNFKVNNLVGVGICFPGHIRYKEGITITTSNLKTFRNFPLVKEMEKLLPVKIILENDANAQAYAEYLYGAGKGYPDQLFMTISSGVGGGIIINGKLYHGMTGTAGEFGHVIVNTSNPIRCTCGNYGCLMAGVCGLNIIHIAKAFIKKGMQSALINPEKLKENSINGKILKMGIENKDPVCEKIVESMAENVAIGVYNLHQIFNPPLIILGGGLMQLGDFFLNHIKTKFKRFARDMIYDDIKIELSGLEEDAGVIGAASLLLVENE